MKSYDVCLNCGHKKVDHDSGNDSRCHRAYCLRMKFKDSLVRSQSG